MSAAASKRIATPSAPKWPRCSENARRFYDRAIRLIQPTTKLEPDDWARANRSYDGTTGKPGKRDPGYTPYVIPFARAIWSRRYKLVVFVTGAQCGKTDAFLDIIGATLDQRPVPIGYVGPSDEFVRDQFEPRLEAMLTGAPELNGKFIQGRRKKKKLKLVAGVRVRLAQGGSATALSSDQWGLALVDEIDKYAKNIKGQGGVIGLVRARGISYADYTIGVASTPTVGNVETEVDPANGLEMWKVADPDDIESQIWKLFQAGLRFHYAWRCPHCAEYFIPRFKCLKYKERVVIAEARVDPKTGKKIPAVTRPATPAESRADTWMVCPRHGCIIRDDDNSKTKESMNATAVCVARGQKIDRKGKVTGEVENSDIYSLWASPLTSPLMTWGERVEAYLTAVNLNDDAEIQSAVNAQFGELHSPGAVTQAPDWQVVRAKIAPYKFGEIPRQVLKVTMGVDVGKGYLAYVKRGWGGAASSWLLDAGMLIGATAEGDVWDQLASLMLTPDAASFVPLKVLVDAGFRPDKPDAGDYHAVYTFARRFSGFVFATRGFAKQSTPIKAVQQEVTAQGQPGKFIITRLNLDSDYFKSQVLHRVRLSPGVPGSFHVPTNVDEEYCHQIMSEVRVVTRTGQVKWFKKGANHFLDAEALAAAGGHLLKVHMLPKDVLRDWEGAVGPDARPDAQPEDGDDEPPHTPAAVAAKKKQETTAERFARMSRRLNR